MSGRTISSSGIDVLAGQLARAVLLLHKEGGLTQEDFSAWEKITGAHVITIRELRRLADAVLDAERASAREGVRA